MTEDFKEEVRGHRSWPVDRMLPGQGSQAGGPAWAKAKKFCLLENQAVTEQGVSSPLGWLSRVPLCTLSPEAGSGPWTWEEPGERNFDLRNLGCVYPANLAG